MPVTTSDTRLQTGRIGPLGQHLPVMVELQYQTITFLQAAKDMGRYVAGVREQSQTTSLMAKQKLARLTGVVGYREGKHLKIPQGEPTGMAIETLQLGQFALLTGAKGARGHPHRQPVATSHSAYTAYVVAVFMGHKDGVERVGFDLQPAESGLYFTRWKATIDQYPQLACLNQQGVTSTAAPQRGETQSHGSETAGGVRPTDAQPRERPCTLSRITH